MKIFFLFLLCSNFIGLQNILSNANAESPLLQDECRVGNPLCVPSVKTRKLESTPSNSNSSPENNKKKPSKNEPSESNSKSDSKKPKPTSGNGGSGGGGGGDKEPNSGNKKPNNPNSKNPNKNEKSSPKAPNQGGADSPQNESSPSKKGPKKDSNSSPNGSPSGGGPSSKGQPSPSDKSPSKGKPSPSDKSPSKDKTSPEGNPSPKDSDGNGGAPSPDSPKKKKNAAPPPPQGSCSHCEVFPGLVKEILGVEPKPCWKVYFNNLIDPFVEEDQIRMSYRSAVKCFEPCLTDLEKEKDLDFLVNECMDWTPFKKMRACQKLALRNNGLGITDLSEDVRVKVYKDCPAEYIELAKRTAEQTGCTLSKKIHGALVGKYKGWMTDENGKCIPEFGSIDGIFSQYVKSLKPITEAKTLGNLCLNSLEEAELLKEIVEQNTSSLNGSWSMKDFIINQGTSAWSTGRNVCGYWLRSAPTPGEKLAFGLKCTDEFNCDMEATFRDDNGSYYRSESCLKYGREKMSDRFEMTASCEDLTRPYASGRTAADGIAYDFKEMPLGVNGIYIHYAFDIHPTSKVRTIRYIGISGPPPKSRD